VNASRCTVKSQLSSVRSWGICRTTYWAGKPCPPPTPRKTGESDWRLLHADSADDSHTVNDLFVSVENDFVLDNLYTAVSSKIRLGLIHCAKPPAKCGVTTANKWTERTHKWSERTPVNQGRQRTLSSRAYGFRKQKEHLLTTVGNEHYCRLMHSDSEKHLRWCGPPN